MSPIDRRQFVTTIVAVGVSSAAARAVPTKEATATPLASESASPLPHSSDIDFRYAPGSWQSTICFPDDPYKTLVGERGELKYGFSSNKFAGVNEFSTIVEFGLQGMQSEHRVSQKVREPGIPIIETKLERAPAILELTAFATQHPNEGRVDNVLLTVRSRKSRVLAAPIVRIRTSEKFKLEDRGESLSIMRREQDGSTFLICHDLNKASAGAGLGLEEGGSFVQLPIAEIPVDKSLRYLIRLPQAGQAAEQLLSEATDADALLSESVEYWRRWKPTENSVVWSLPSQHQAFLVACARNVQQAREIKDGRSLFQVGPTVYRGLWIVDGNFLLEAARYLGYDREAEDGLRAEWGKQLPSGQIVAGGGEEHWKDTAIAMFTLVRQCELAQDWRLFRELEPNVLQATDFLIQLRDKARTTNTPNGRYGLLAPGFPDGGIGGVCYEFTNTLWTLAGLKAVSDAAQQLKMRSLDRVNTFYRELREACSAAAKQELARHPDGFSYLPMLMKGDPAFENPAVWWRPRPQSAQWALSHTIFPGLVFDPQDPVVRGHIALMQACTKEEIPAETGWLLHEAVWNYGASFAAHVYLWAGLRDWAHSTFVGFLNHAAPVYCWREEQPWTESLINHLWGDMPHNWASAECVRFLRHMYVLEDGESLRLLSGVTDAELKSQMPCAFTQTPTRFGRINLRLEPVGRAEWKLSFAREDGTAPKQITLPQTLGSKLRPKRLEGASLKIENNKVEVDPGARRWSLILT